MKCLAAGGLWGCQCPCLGELEAVVCGRFMSLIANSQQANHMKLTILQYACNIPLYPSSTQLCDNPGRTPICRMIFSEGIIFIVARHGNARQLAVGYRGIGYIHAGYGLRVK